jgi:nitrite reductase/ring-hydroxylating ferredoxin subunit
LTLSFDTGLLRSELDPERPLPIETPWGPMTLFVAGERVFATQSFCTHLEGPLFQGTLSGETITCPWHQWRFSLADGKRLDVPSILSCEADTLIVCDVESGPRGTLVLSRARRGSRAIEQRSTTDDATS